MPTGYTAKLYEGKPQTFQEFALSCARAFGALISTKEDRMDAPIPEAFEPDSYYAQAIDRDRQALREIASLSEPECAARAERGYLDAVASHAKSLADSKAIRERYAAMLERVRAWVPPSSEHVGLKNFMEEQLASATKFDDMTEYYERNAPKRKTGAEWQQAQIDALTHSIGYSIEHHAKEHSLAAQRTRWINDLRKSLR